MTGASKKSIYEVIHVIHRIAISEAVTETDLDVKSKEERK